MKILYVTRKFPPTIGGMENVAAWLQEELAARATVKLIKFGGANKYLPIVYPWLVCRALIAGWKSRPDIIYVQDGLMGAATPILRSLIRRPVVATIHGTEMVYKNPLYRKTVIPALRSLDGAVAISHATEDKIHSTLPSLPTKLIHWGVRDDVYLPEDRGEIKKKLGTKINVSFDGRSAICLAGRLTDRKGALWFVQNVMPSLHQTMPRLICLIAGNGKDYDAIAVAIDQLHLQDVVRLLGYVSNEQRRLLYNAADLFIMPNRAGFGFEGFGMVAIEATSCGTPAIVGAFAGTIDTIVPDRTGWLVPAENTTAFIERITSELEKPSLIRADVRKTTCQVYDWDTTATQYLAYFSDIIAKYKK